MRAELQESVGFVRDRGYSFPFGVSRLHGVRYFRPDRLATGPAISGPYECELRLGLVTKCLEISVCPGTRYTNPKESRLLHVRSRKRIRCCQVTGTAALLVLPNAQHVWRLAE